MKLSDYLLDKDLFTAIKTAGEFDFILNDDIPNLNLLLVLENGCKSVYYPYQSIGIESLAGLIALKFRSKWNGYIEMELLNLNVNNRNEISETIVTVEERINSKSDVDKVSAYDSNVLIDDKGVESTGSDNVDGERVRTVVDEKIAPETAYKALDTLTKNGILNRVISDVSGFLTLSIY